MGNLTIKEALLKTVRATKDYVDNKIKLPTTEQITIDTVAQMPWIYFTSSSMNSRKDLLGCELTFTAMVVDDTETEEYHEETIKVTFTQEIVDGLYSTSEGLDYFFIENFLDAEERKNITGMIAFYPGQAFIIELYQGDKIVGGVKDTILTKTVKVYEKDTLIDVSYMEAKLPFDDYEQFIEPSYEDDNQFYFYEDISDLSMLKGAKLMFVIGGPISSEEEDEVIDIVELEFTDEVYNTFYQQVGTYRLDQMLTPEENSRNLYGGFVFTEEDGQGLLFRIYNTPNEESDSVYYKVPEASLEIKVKGYANDTLVDKKYVDEAIDTDNLVITNSISMGRKEGTTIGTKSTAVGSNVTASGDYSHAEGAATASGDYSHAEGATTASGDCSHAEGLHSEASADYSHAEGFATKASGPRSHAEGYYTIAAGNSQHVQGKHNIEDTTNTYAHIVGNGTSGSARSNAHTLDWEGNAWFAGNVKVGADSKKLATEDYVDINAECLFKASLGNYQRIASDTGNKSATQVSSDTFNTYFPDAFLAENINGSIKRYNFNATVNDVTYDANGIGDKSISESFDMVFVSLFNSEGKTITQRYIALDSLTVIDFTNKVEGQHAYFKSVMLKITPDAIYEANIGGNPVAKKGMIAVRWEVKSNTNVEEWINKVKDFKITIALTSRSFLATDNTVVYTPTSDYHPATKKYVDDKLAGLQIAQMTLTEYNALETKDPNTLYIISEE